ncbi:MAG TPA: PAS domain S-box protein [Rubrobacteraceae bacterium]|nr:PAS domain S-box protein [Rubrobacteraceae bacterium]
MPTHTNGSPGEDNRWLRSVVENSSEIVTIVDPDGTLRYASPAFERVLGHDPEEAVGTMNVLDLVHLDDLSHVLEETEKALSEGGIVTNKAEYRFRHADGSWRWMESVGTYLLEDPNVGGVVVTSRDVTERKEAEERFRVQYRNLPVPTYTWRRIGEDFVLVDHNDAADEFTDGHVTDVLGARANELLSDRPLLLEMIRRCFERRTTSRREMPWRMLQSGEEKRFVVTCVFVPPDLVMVHIEDITERVRAEERLRFQAQLLGAVGEAVIALDMEGKVVYWNRAAEELYGWSSQETRGRILREMAIPESLRERAENVAAQLRDGRNWTGEFVVRRRDGTTFPVEGTNTPVFDENGEQLGVVGVLRDVTERKEAEEALRRSEAEIFSVLESITDAFFALDREWRFTYINSQAEVLFSRRREDLIGERIWEDPTFYPQYQRAVAEGVTARFEAYYPPLAAWYSVRAYPSESGMSVYLQDITERRRAEEALKESEQRFRGSFENAATGMALVGIDGRFLRVNKSLCEIIGYSQRELLGKTLDDITHPDDLEVDREDLQRLLTGETRTYQVEKRYLHEEGRVVWALLSLSLVYDEEDEPFYFISQIQDLSERKRMEEQFQLQALRDTLTGLPNRKLFMDRLGHALERTRRTRGHKVAVLFLDLDGFKVINDSLGHDAGDLLLMVVTERLRRSLRPEDTLARFGGDEFVVLLEEVENPGDAVRVARRITEEFRRPFVLEGRGVFASASIGIAFGDAHSESPVDLLRRADTAMYRAKHEHTHYRIFDPGMYVRSVERLELESDLRRAMENEEFVVRYQPIVDLETGKACGAEALVRWVHPERGLLNPSEFMSVIEESGLVVSMGERVLEEACRQAQRWQDDPHIPSLVVSVNLSAVQLRRSDLASTIEETLRKTGLDASRLSLDVTETAYIQVLEEKTATLDRLKKLGVNISIDDFGVGYSSLSYLKRLPADTLKIDKSFVVGLGEDMEDTAIMRMVIDLAHTLGMKAVAEGVESAEQAALLAEMGCDLAQGYYFAKPLSPDEVPKFLAE